MLDFLNEPLKIGVIEDPPYTSPCTFDRVCPNRGSGVEMASLVCQWLRWTCTFVRYDFYAYGTGYENGTGTGMIHAIQKGEFDTSLPIFDLTFARHHAIDFSQPIYFVDAV